VHVIVSDTSRGQHVRFMVGVAFVAMLVIPAVVSYGSKSQSPRQRGIIPIQSDSSTPIEPVRPVCVLISRFESGYPDFLPTLIPVPLFDSPNCYAIALSGVSRNRVMPHNVLLSCRGVSRTRASIWLLRGHTLIPRCYSSFLCRLHYPCRSWIDSDCIRYVHSMRLTRGVLKWLIF